MQEGEIRLAEEDIRRFYGFIPAHEDVKMKIGCAQDVRVLRFVNHSFTVDEMLVLTIVTSLRSINVRIGRWIP